MVSMASGMDGLMNLMKLPGALGAALVDSNSGMMLGATGAGLDLELAAAGNTEVLRAELRTMQALAVDDVIEDILITLTTQYHIIRPVQAKQGVFVYLVLDRSQANLALARRAAQEAEQNVDL
jgi:predicted regulator of Ras-like GTPase activity (Roadblock/LC7/MglB family)